MIALMDFVGKAGENQGFKLDRVVHQAVFQNIVSQC
jgi:hypothetical protein